MIVLGWNAQGHRMIAQIAYDRLSDHAREVLTRYNQALDKVYKPMNFVNAATWLDQLSYQDIKWYSVMHYIDLPFSQDGTALPNTEEINALWAIENAIHLIQNKYPTDFDKGIALRVLIHVVGDIHQPMHAITRVSKDLPMGDRGGNLVPLYKNAIANNLHAYWDRGGGLLKESHRNSKKKMRTIQSAIICESDKMDLVPAHWAEASHQIAISIAYHLLPEDHIPTSRYQQLTQKAAEQQIILAGCRLSVLLEQIVSNLSTYS